MNNFLLLIALASYFIIGKNILTSFGFPFQFTENIILFVSFIVVSLNINKLILGKNRQEIAILLFFIILLVIYLLADSSDNFGLARLYVLPPLTCAAIPVISNCTNQSNRLFWRCCFIIFFFSFLWESGLAISERFLEYNFFAWKTSESEIDFVTSDVRLFRSAALYGHPLYNALMVSIAMAFILVSSLKNSIKYALWSVGYLAVLSFNTRSTMIANPLFLAIYLLYVSIFQGKTNLSKKLSNIFIVSVFVVVVFQVVSFFELGYRLIELGMVDDYGSTQARIEVWSLLNELTLKDFLWGVSINQKHSLMFHYNFVAVENFAVEMILQIGIILFCILVFLYYRLIKRMLSFYNKFNALFVILVFLCVASFNNSLGSNSMALLYFLFLCSVFDPRIAKYSIPKKLLSSHNSDLLSRRKNYIKV